MNDKVKKFLKYLGVAFLGAVIGCSTLIAVSSCSAKTQTQVKQVNASSLTNLEGTYRGNSFESYFDTSLSGGHRQYQYYFSDDFTRYNGTTYIDFNVDENQSYFFNPDFGSCPLTSIRFNLYFANYQDSIVYGEFREIKLEYNDGDGHAWYTLFEEGHPPHYIYFVDYDDNFPDCAYFYFPSVYDIFCQVSGFESRYCYDFVIQNWFNVFSYYNIGANFTFNDLINYNAPYGKTTNDLFISESTFNSSLSPLTVNKSYLVGPFVSNGRVFNEIIFSYVNGYATRYINGDGTTSVLNVEHYGYFQAIFYKNNYTLEQVDVCYRNYGQYSDSGGNFQTYLDYGVNWVNNDYKKLYFIEGLTSEQRDDVAQFNNNVNLTGISVYGGDVGLSNVFDLLKVAFASWIPILNISVIPGITLGLLLFLPLIITIVITIIWLIKR